MSLRAMLAGVVLLASAAAPAVALQSAAPATTVPASPTNLRIPAPDGRTIPMIVWTAPDEKGVIVFSHGFGGAPEAYQRLTSAWAARGFTVIAPLHTDSQKHPERTADGATAYSTRLMDLGVARALAAHAHPGKPLIVAGHSFGSLMSLIQAGASTPGGAAGDPAVKGVIAFSSPGPIPYLVTDQTYASVAAPLLMITGDEDLVPGYADDWRDHRLPFDASPPGDKTLLIVSGGDHQLVIAESAFAPILAASELFLDAYALDDAGAKVSLAGFAAPGVAVEHR